MPRKSQHCERCKREMDECRCEAMQTVRLPQGESPRGTDDREQPLQRLSSFGEALRRAIDAIPNK
jgi:hypothetical protein